MLTHPLPKGTELRFPSGMRVQVQHVQQVAAEWVYYFKGSSVPWTQRLLDTSGAETHEDKVPPVPPADSGA